MPAGLAPDDAVDRARRLLDPRLETIKELATTRAACNDARAAAEKAETADARAYAAAIKAGWTEADLRSVGFDAPRKRLPGRPSGTRSSRQSPPDTGSGSEVSTANDGVQPSPM